MTLLRSDQKNTIDRFINLLVTTNTPYSKANRQAVRGDFRISSFSKNRYADDTASSPKSSVKLCTGSPPDVPAQCGQRAGISSVVRYSSS